MPSIDANFPTAEFSACGKLWRGLGICVLERGADLASVELEIKGYFDGAVKIDSTDCNLDELVRYSKHQSVRPRLIGPAAESCLISFVVSPEFPNEASQGIKVNSLVGHLWLTVELPGETWGSYLSKVRAGKESSIRVELGEKQGESAHAIFFGCDSTYETDLVVDAYGAIDLKATQILGRAIAKESCILEGGIIIGKNQYMLTWMIWGYDEHFLDLPDPLVTLSNGKLTLKGDQNVSALSLDDSWSICNEHTIKKFDPAKPHIARALTVNGRSALGVWSPEKKEFSWIR